ncbi:MAG: hypothetical protein ACLFPA_13405 [Dichotomicrobium sp.]
MAGVFDDFPLEFRGVDYTIPADRRMGAIAAVEEVITLAELTAMCARESVPLGRLSAAYGALLRYAGAKVSDEEVYAGMFSDGDFFEAAVLALQGLMSLMLPPAALNGAGEEAADVAPGEKKTDPPKASGSSKASTRRSSARARSRRRSSGG